MSFIKQIKKIAKALTKAPIEVPTNNFNMEEFKLSDDVFDQIKDFNRLSLTEEQKLLIDKLILNEELKKCYKRNGLCGKCKQPKNNIYWCQICAFQQNFQNWISGNHDIDEFIQKAQLKAKIFTEF